MGWTLDDIPWDKFDATKIDPQMLKNMKAASLVEYNSGDYATYLCNVFKDDPQAQADIKQWAVEEKQHGLALAKWAERADPNFNFEESFKAFTEGFHIDLEVENSIRGSRCGEFIARCMVEIGTSSYYSSMKDACDEPVLKYICQKIAADEFKHYKLFYTYMKKYLEVDKLNLWKRISITLSRIRESEDDELAYAYFSANDDKTSDYNREKYRNYIIGQSYKNYRYPHLQRVVNMSFKAVGLKANDKIVNITAKVAHKIMQRRAKMLIKKSAA